MRAAVYGGLKYREAWRQNGDKPFSDYVSASIPQYFSLSRSSPSWAQRKFGGLSLSSDDSFSEIIGIVKHWIDSRELRKLAQLDAAETLEFLRSPPGNRLGDLKGNRSGQHSIRINDQWRVCFRWTDTGPTDAEIADCH